MAASSRTMIHHLPAETAQKHADLIALLDAISAEVQRFNHDNMELRKAGLAEYEAGIEPRILSLTQRVEEAQSPERRRFKGVVFSSDDFRDKNTLLAQMNKAITQQAYQMAIFEFLCCNAGRNLGGCQELAEISGALLKHLYHTYGMASPRIETVAVEITDPNYLQRGSTHEIVVLQRNPDSRLEDVAAWGNDCLVFDPWAQTIYTPKTIPAGFVLEGVLQTGGHGYGVKIKFYHELPSSHFTSMVSHRTFGPIARITRDLLDNEYFDQLARLTSPFLSPAILDKWACTILGTLARTEALQHKSRLVTDLETLSGLSLTGRKTEAWHTHHYAVLHTPDEAAKAQALCDRLPQRSRISYKEGFGRFVLFANTNIHSEDSHRIHREMYSAPSQDTPGMNPK